MNKIPDIPVYEDVLNILKIESDELSLREIKVAHDMLRSLALQYYRREEIINVCNYPLS